MQNFIRWLSDHKLGNILILIAYYAIVVLPHEKVGYIIAKLFDNFTRDKYNAIILWIFLGLTFILGLMLFKAVRRHHQKGLLLTYILMTAFLMIFCFNALFVINVEVVHFPQYACFAILAFPLIGSFPRTLFWTIVAGAIDEGYQFLVLAPRRPDYYDFNDVVINLVGAAAGLIILKIFSVPERKALGPFLKKPELLFLAGLVSALAIMYVTGHFAIVDTSENPAFLTLIHKPVEGFWTMPPGPYAKYHVLRPLPGLIIIILLFVFYSGLSDKSNWPGRRNPI